MGLWENKDLQADMTEEDIDYTHHYCGTGLGLALAVAAFLLFLRDRWNAGRPLRGPSNQLSVNLQGKTNCKVSFSPYDNTSANI